MITNDTLFLLRAGMDDTVPEGMNRLALYALGTMVAHTRRLGFEVPQDCSIIQTLEFWTGFCDSALKITTHGLMRVTMDASTEVIHQFGIFIRSANKHSQAVSDEDLERLFSVAELARRIDFRGKLARFVIETVYQPGVVYERRRQIEVEGMGNV